MGWIRESQLLRKLNSGLEQALGAALRSGVFKFPISIVSIVSSPPFKVNPMIKKLIKHKPWTIVPLWIMNQLLVLDFMVASLIGFDPRLSVSAVLGIYLHREKITLGWLPKAFRVHCLESAFWWDYNFPPVNRSIWSK